MNITNKKIYIELIIESNIVRNVSDEMIWTLSVLQ